MLAFELADQAPKQAGAIVAAAFDRGLLLLACGMYGNVIRLLAPLTIGDADLEQGLSLLEESLDAAL
jgi:4-aminobutyrate aminotransferase-like enzyme